MGLCGVHLVDLVEGGVDEVRLVWLVSVLFQWFAFTLRQPIFILSIVGIKFGKSIFTSRL